MLVPKNYPERIATTSLHALISRGGDSESQVLNHFGLQAVIHPRSLVHRWAHPPQVDATSYVSL